MILIALEILRMILYYALLFVGLLLCAYMSGYLLMGLLEYLLGRRFPDALKGREFYIGLIFVSLITIIAWYVS